ncbi:hypothetical protein PsYK624_152350 [Phanerochaete sordida]|uniref:Auxin efflux carrier n=1 Tax=Phanerochaete sordida TaxID=48140 RepID=A0A9P3LM51_9APHY|nr:hypothetical protein PsYK624_152350 [Phanerochaete sordida]
MAKQRPPRVAHDITCSIAALLIAAPCYRHVQLCFCESESPLVASLAGASEGAISVLLTLLAGYVSARAGLLDHRTVRLVSGLCSRLFLPCLIVVQMGPELTARELSAMWIVPAWGLASTLLAHAIGWAGRALLHTPYWVVVAAGRPNATALPLLLVQSLAQTGVLDRLASDGASAERIQSRAKSLLLLNAVVQQTFTFQLAPAILRRDANGADDEETWREELAAPSSGQHKTKINPIIQDAERVGLLQDHARRSYGTEDDGQPRARQALESVADESDMDLPYSLEVAGRVVKKAFSWMSPPLIAALIALLFGLITPLHNIAYDQQSAFYSSITQAAKNLGELFVTLQMFLVGAELAIVPSAHPGVVSGGFSLLVRFVIMPGFALLFVWATAGQGWYINDKLVWFLLVLIPSGPSAMLLANVAETVGVDQGPIAGYLIISYLLCPLMAAVCAFGLHVVENASN